MQIPAGGGTRQKEKETTWFGQADTAELPSAYHDEHQAAMLHVTHESDDKRSGGHKQMSLCAQKQPVELI